MGYERNDRGYNSGSTYDRDRQDPIGPDRGRATNYGHGSRDYRGDRFDDRGDARGNPGRGDYGRADYGDPGDRGFFDRAGDEVRSWFGDEDAERRRRGDAREDERYRSYGSGAYTSGYRGGDDRGQARGSSDYAPSGAGYRGDNAYGVDRSRYGAINRGETANTANNNAQSGRHDHSYHSWRDREIQALDRDYHDYARENQSRFDTEFGSWRQNRQGQRQLLDKVQEHQDVVGSDGTHVGTVDHVRGDHIRLTKQDNAAGGHHHAIPSTWIQSVDDKVTLTKTADEAKRHWRDDERGDKSAPGNPGQANLNRSFSGTY